MYCADAQRSLTQYAQAEFIALHLNQIFKLESTCLFDIIACIQVHVHVHADVDSNFIVERGIKIHDFLLVIDIHVKSVAYKRGGTGGKC